MDQSSAGDQWPSEEEYCCYLAAERHLYAFVLREHGGFSALEAEKEALERYPYESADDEYRGLIFHDESWHWAMLRLHGERYWDDRSELRQPSEAYRREAAREDLWNLPLD
ncbi:MAG: hypothetical protein LBE51_19120 [Acidovorax sp.]|jgi:hypothetical protein|uniref:hypothetical protein n=1 Tax=Comamonas sp. TaxID=34028 RepID=UPI002832ED38|nr:hypothetical protein [Comamonas sp.]MDR0215408.1 hypothetical protein [Comamonas sp.]MDR2327499.1 hypothetical protein [Acidovorax sp.]